MPQKTAIVSLTIGPMEVCERLFLPSVKAYAKRIGADFHQLREPLDTINVNGKSPMIMKHMLCMQKMLVPTLPFLQEYDWILIIDSDILMNYENAPNIFDQVKDGFICGVNEREQFGLDDYSKVVFQRFAPHIPGDYEGYYKRLGFDTWYPRVINTGFLVLQPKLHAPFFRSLYDKYMPRIINNEDIDGDQGPLNYEGGVAGILHCLDPRWNRLWILTHVLLYPFLEEHRDRHLLQQALKNQFELNYCIHMAGHVGWSLLQ